MTSQHRKHRGYATQALVADWFARHGHPFATPAGAGRQGRDVLGTLGLAIEVKARRDLSPMAWLRQAASTAAGDLPCVVFRCDGQGEAALPDWGVLLRLEDFTRLTRAAGYGDPEDTTEPKEKP